MNSGRITGPSNQGLYIYIEWSSNSDNIKNETCVDVTLYLYVTGTINSYAVKYGKLRIADEIFDFEKTIGEVGEGSFVLGTFRKTVKHDEDGNFKCMLGAYYTISITYNGIYVYSLGIDDVTFDLEKIEPQKLNLDSHSFSNIGAEQFTVCAEFSPAESEAYILNNGSEYKVLSGESYTITGLSPNTTYYPQIQLTGTNSVSTIFDLGTVTTEKISVTGITLDIENYTLEENKQYKLITTVSPSNASDKGIEYTSDNPSIASVNSSGEVTALLEGTAIITAKSLDNPDKTSCCTITVKKPTVNINIINPQVIIIPNGETPVQKQLVYEVIPFGSTYSVTFTSNNETVATINETGIITAKASGIARITATIKYNDEEIDNKYIDIKVTKCPQNFIDVSLDSKYLDVYFLKKVYMNLLYLKDFLSIDVSTYVITDEFGYDMKITKILQNLNIIESMIDEINTDNASWFNKYYNVKKDYNNLLVPSKSDVQRWIDFCELVFDVVNKTIKKPMILLDSSGKWLKDKKDKKENILLIGDGYYAE